MLVVMPLLLLLLMVLLLLLFWSVQCRGELRCVWQEGGFNTKRF